MNERSESKGGTDPSVDRIVLLPLERPVVIDAIRCRLSQDCVGARMAGRLLLHSIPTNELEWIVSILDAAREFARHWEPNETEKLAGNGDPYSCRAAKEKLLQAIKSEVKQ